MFMVTKQNGQCMAMPDVCQTPAPPLSPIPVPYPNTAVPMLGNPATEKVLVCGMPALTRSSKIAISNGNQAGCMGGVVSSKIMGKTEFVTGSMTVTLEGSPALRLGDTTKQNDGNAIGSVLMPSQSVVMVLS